MKRKGVTNLIKRILMFFSFLLFIGIASVFTGFTRAQTEVPATPVTTPIVAGHATGGVKALSGHIRIKLDFNAHSNPKGKVNYSDNTGDDFKGKVDKCYYQTSNIAVFAGTVDKGSVSERYFVVQVQDNGQGKNSEPDMVGVLLTDMEPTCIWNDHLLTAEVQKGNLVVH